MRRRRWKARYIITAFIVPVFVWLAIDLYGPHSADIRDFDPEEVGRLETAMWRSYYNRERVQLFNQLVELMQTQYQLPLARSHAVAYQAAKAAFVFKDGRKRSDYEQALPNLVTFYTAIRNVSNVAFDVDRAARLELEWWIIHRERTKHPPDDLVRALAALPAEVYHVPAGRLMEHARLRAKAMVIRDTKAAAGGVTESDWEKIDDLLRASWQSLWQAVNA